MYGQRYHAGARGGQSACEERLFVQLAREAVRRGQNPGLFDQLAKLDAPPPRPGACRAGRHQHLIVEQGLGGQVFFCERNPDSTQQQFNIALPELTIFQRRGIGMNGVEDHAWMLAQQALGDGRQNPSCHWLGAADTKLPDGRVCQKVHLFQPLAQLVENRDPALKKRLPVNRGFDALRAAVE